MTINVKQIAKELGRRGGQKTKELHGKNHFVLMAQKSAEAKQKKKLSTPDI